MGAGAGCAEYAAGGLVGSVQEFERQGGQLPLIVLAWC